MTSYTNKGVNVCVNDMRATERMYERMYVRVSVRASVRVSVRPCVCTVTRHVRASVRTSRPYFCMTQPFFTFLVGTFARTEIRSNKVDFVCARVASERANARTHAHASVHLCAHVRSLLRSHVRSSVHSFALRSSPRPLATRTPYVHRISWSFKTNVDEALQKN